MILQFPDIATLEVVLRSGMLPADVISAPTVFACGNDGRILVRCDKELPTAEQQRLQSSGVQFRKTFRGAGSRTTLAGCWPEILPVQPLAGKRAVLDALQQAAAHAVLLAFSHPDSLQRRLHELLALGHDRIRLCTVDTPNGSLTLLHVMQPPWYTLLGLLKDDSAVDDGNVTMFAEVRSRVWLEIGQQHPLADCLNPADGQQVLIGVNQQWIWLDDLPFHDIYGHIDFQLPTQPVTWTAAGIPGRYEVPLRLVPAPTDDLPELWILTRRGREQLEEFVQTADSRLLQQLSFAVADHGESEHTASENSTADGPQVVIRVRPSARSLPVVVFDALPFRRFLQLPHLFLPIGQRLQPPLRRDVVRSTLAADDDLVTWLWPTTDDKFVPQSIPEASFLPLSEWAQYVLDEAAQELTAWSQSLRFDFDDFRIESPSSNAFSPHGNSLDTRLEDNVPASDLDNPARTVVDNTTAPPDVVTADPEPVADEPVPTVIASVEKNPVPPVSSPASDKTLAAAEELQQLRTTAFADWKNCSAAVESDEQSRMWFRLARRHAAAGQIADASQCWAIGLWEQSQFPSEEVAAWFDCVTAATKTLPLIGDDFTTALSADPPTPTQVNLVAVHLIAAAFAKGVSSRAPSEFPQDAAQFLTRYDSRIPVRTVWLTWRAYARLAPTDTLTPARGRDRLLSRLFRHGLRAEQDLPAFLGQQNQLHSPEQAEVTQLAIRLHSTVETWCSASDNNSGHPAANGTRACCNLLFAFLHAAFQDTERVRVLQARAATLLQQSPAETQAVYRWIERALNYRIQRRLKGEAPATALPKEVAQFEGAPGLRSTATARDELYVRNQLQSRSQILQPLESRNPYSQFLQGDRDQSFYATVNKVLAIEDAPEFQQQFLALMSSHGAEQVVDRHRNETLISLALLNTPRFPAEETRKFLKLVPTALNRLKDACAEALVLQRAFRTASCYQWPEFLQSQLPQMRNLFSAHYHFETSRNLRDLLAEAVRAFVQAGLNEDIAKLLEELEHIEPPSEQAATPARASRRRTRTQQINSVDRTQAAAAEIHSLKTVVAGGWFSLEQTERARPLLQSAMDYFLSEDVANPKQRRAGFKSCLQALGYLPLEKSATCLHELVERCTPYLQTSAGGTVGRLNLLDRWLDIELLELCETLVLNVISAAETRDAATQALLDTHEYHVRRRILQDSRTLLKEATQGTVFSSEQEDRL